MNPDTPSLYNQDFLMWTEQQAHLLESHCWHKLDIANLTEEILALGKQQRQEFRNRLAVLLTHLLKGQYQPHRRGQSWILTIKEQRLQVDELLQDNPSLNADIEALQAASYRLAILRAAQETKLDENQFPVNCPYTFAQIMSANFWPENPNPEQAPPEAQ
ncbi:hypothetical protein GlitD10_2005 [Gloeomargarita lithophora Alchichica-D10]|uniref:DUF29 domain-containing protein n=1 Tax=Gloeomargarita lithophora Alchichica-D10 TaxID=1188229 RepID=A0A1J0AEK7_9CYAN|nr:DUF29 domain-containing protein [Gloeomargarita lithophora]APB34331.1 hypothetical protein GlitD10_2005 [Gloeomargarita lithophora Alchichica-D10]